MANFQTLTPEYQRAQDWYKVTECYFREHSLVDHQLSSYNKFMREKLPDIITNTDFEYTKDSQKYVVNFEDLYVKKPIYVESSGVSRRLKPQDCRLRNLNYTCHVHVNIIRYTVENEKIVDTQTFPDVFIGAMPCMVLSDYCSLQGKNREALIKNKEDYRDPGGYFIIGGTEKVLMSQDRMAHNEIFIFKSKDKDTIKIKITDTDKNKSIPCDWSAEVRSYSPAHEPNISTTYMKLSKQRLDKGEEQLLYVIVPGLQSPVPWPILFKALGVEDVDEMINYICDPEDIPIVALLTPSLDCSQVRTQKEALEYLSDFVLHSQRDQRMTQIKRILREKLFQNVSSIEEKRFYFGHMTYQILATCLGRRKEDDRDHYGKKRVETAGNLINNLFKSIWKRIIRETINNLLKKRTNDLAQLFFGKFSNYIRQPFATGNWVATKTSAKAAKVGISQLLNRHNYVATISNLRRVITPSDKNSKIIKPRHLHSSQWPFICPAETPEGQACGLIKNLALLTIVSTGSSEEPILDWLRIKSDLVELIEDGVEDPQTKVKIFINGGWVGCTEKAKELVSFLRSLKRSAKIDIETSISYSGVGIRIFTDEGRVLSPFFISENGSSKSLPPEFDWDLLLEDGYLEYLDPSELENLKHSMYPWEISRDDTHSFVHPSFILGVSGGTAPFPDHNQSPRNIYQAAMGKQALGIYATNFLERYDTNAHIMCYPQLPLVDTAAMRLMGTHDLPYGQNLIVAVMSAGYNQEDSVIVNQQSLDNGALRSINYITYNESCHRKGNTIDEIKCPEKTSVKETRLKGYNKLDQDGISKENTPLSKRDVVIGKVNSTVENVRDTSVLVKTNGMEENSVVELEQDGEKLYSVGPGSAIVDRAILTLNEDSFRTAKVRVRQLRIPQIGDKVASRSAQKGIIGMTVPPEDMPFSEKTGMSPDLIMNPNAFPSRMTIGQALETLLGKACALNGAHADCTPFEPTFSRELISAELRKYGFDECGDETFINGLTGEEIPCKIFVGPTYYQRLKHMVDDKIHARSQDGPRETLTRQPVEGRKRGGGFRFGEMETWCGISHGASSFLIDRLVNNSDGYEMFVCNYCGNAVIATLRTNRFECKRCQQNTAISKIRVPYAFKLLQQELLACGIGVWFNVDDRKTLVSATTLSR